MKVQRTRSQEKVFQLLKTLNRAISAQELYIELRQSNQNMGLATVYRSLEALKLEGSVKIRTLPNGEALYSLVQADQHHLTCVNCGQSFPVDECPVHHLEDKLEQTYHFKVYYHTLEFFGLCNQCQEV
jgi:Fur family ferric uptake transcriptional regulator